MKKVNSFRMRTFAELLKKSFYMLIRDRQSMIIIFFAPIVMMIILGFVIAGLSGGTSSVSVRTAVYISSRILKTYKPEMKKVMENAGIDVFFVKKEDDIEKLLKDGKAQLGISMSDSKVIFFYNQSFGQYNNYLTDLQEFISERIRDQLSRIPLYIKLKPITVETGSSLTVIGFIVPGVMAIAMLMAEVLSMSTTLGAYRENESIKRLRTTPLSGSLFVSSLALNRFWPSILSAYFTVLTSEWIFSTNYHINWFFFTILMATSILFALGMGTVFSLIFKDLWTTVSFSTIVLVIMMLFSNVFYPFSIMPNYMRIVARFLPITYFAEGIRYTLGIEPIYLWKFLTINVVFLLSGLSMLFVGGRAMFFLERR